MLEIKNVTKRYGSKVAVSNLSLTVNDGEIFGFIGHNGAGKTTLIKAIVGIHGIEEGEILLDGISIVKDPIRLKKDIAYIPDNPDVYPNIKGIDYLNFIADIYEVNSQERRTLIEKYANLFEILPHLGDVISSYSHGMRQKLVLISALLHKPRLLILDEPFVGLDPKAAKTLKDIMKEITKDGAMIFFSSHVLEVVEKLCNRVGIIKDGKLVMTGMTEDIKGTKGLESVFLEITNEN